MGKIIVDICGTLFNSNTTYDFCRFFFVNSKRYRILEIIFNSSFIYLLNAACFKLMRKDIKKIILIKMLNGYSYEELYNAANLFYDQYLQNCKSEIVICSATLDFIADAIANKMHIELHISSRLLYTLNAKCKGKILVDLYGMKKSALQAKNISPPFEAVFTDDISDIELLKFSVRRFVIVSKKKRHKWDVLLKKSDIINYKYLYSNA